MQGDLTGTQPPLPDIHVSSLVPIMPPTFDLHLHKGKVWEQTDMVQGATALQNTIEAVLSSAS